MAPSIITEKKSIYCYFRTFARKKAKMERTEQVMTSGMVIAGPCSVESREQMRRSVATLSQIAEVTLVRCGVWKPRTRPGGFEGLGEPALMWIKELREEYPTMRFCCEVAQPEHVELCHHYGMDAVWIGARTSGNPFSVEELARALQGSSMTVMVKNPIAADVGLWQGAIERVMQAGVAEVGAIHRGFFLYHDTCPYRNKPLWEVPGELRRRMPSLRILTDPSHIGGHRQYLAELMITAANLGFDGYMIEVHENASEALTDRDQQIDAATLRRLLDRVRQERCEHDADVRLSILRQQIDAIDERLILAMRDRMEMSRKIAQLKKGAHMSVIQPDRWALTLRQRTALAEAVGLDSRFMKELYEAIHRESVKIQNDTIEKR